MPPTSATTTTLPPMANLHQGSTAFRVIALQEHLEFLRNWFGAVDGTFRDGTQQAVYALQKSSGLARDGVVGPKPPAALAEGTVPTPRSARGDVVEVDLALDCR